MDQGCRSRWVSGMDQGCRWGGQTWTLVLVALSLLLQLCKPPLRLADLFGVLGELPSLAQQLPRRL